MMKQCIITAIFLPIYLFAQDSSSVYDQKLNQLRKYIGIIENAEFDSEVYNTLVERLDSLGIKDEQLQDGFEWGGGKAGFEVYIKNNIDSLIAKFKMVILNPDTLKFLAEIDSSEVIKKIEPVEKTLKPVKDLTVKILPKEEIKIIKDESTKKSAFSGLRLSGNLGKALLKGASLSSHSSYVEPSFFIRFPYGINIGSFLTSIGYETAKYSFQSSSDTVSSYFGSGNGLLLNINISKIIKIGGEKVVKEFVVGTQSYDHGSGFVAGYNLNLILGKLPFSISISSRFNTITFEESGGSTYWASLSAGIGLDL